MARRCSAMGEAHRTAAGGAQTHGVAPDVSGFFRVYWPPNASDEEIDEVIHGALAELLAAVRVQRGQEAAS